MNSWILESSKMIRERKNPYTGGCLIAFATVFLGTFTLVSLTYFGIAAGSGEATLFSGFIAFFSLSLFLIFIISILQYRKASHIIRTIEFDFESSLIVLKETGKSNVEFSLAEFVSYTILFRSERSGSSGTSTSSRTWKYWDLYLLHEDGSMILLETFRDPNSLEKVLEDFKQKLPLPVWDRSKGSFTDSHSKEILKNAIPAEPQVSEWIRTETLGSDLRVRLMEKKSAGNRLISLLVPTIFYGAWATILISFLREPGNMIFLIFLVPFSLLFLGILTVATVFVLFRKTEIRIDSSGMRILYSTSIPILSVLLARERKFDPAEIRQIRTLRIENEIQILCVALKKTARTPETFLLDFLFNAQAVSLHDKRIPGDRELLGIWTLSSWAGEKGPSYSDLVYAERFLQKNLGIAEEKLSFSDLTA
ncbi:hypothetical protein EHQ61_13070 [Leptospira wolffii]|uniref:hypothetical protein n=1 Tax=Leptospira wolffii TaxID=409998 RepID=UPI00108272E1|nr:hypothetical protein [Leptospira wolffii]TGL49376.1 hypothetical protein EHQ61_13070 [Leptospira wolffii]